MRLGLLIVLLRLTASLVIADPALIHNLDGDLSFRGATPETSVILLRELIDREAALSLDTVCWSIGAGSDILYYPTKVASTWGWRHTKYNDDPRWKTRIEKCRIATNAGLDAPRIVGERLHEHGLKFIPSYRMNDAHFTSDPLNYPLTGRFWMEHQDATIGVSPVAGFDGYRHLLNYARDDVRAYRLSILFEAMDRYENLMDGFELDFNRFQIFFPPGEAERGGPLITEMVRQVSQRLRTLAEKHGRSMPLIVRVPPSMENCAWAGLELKKWMQESLIDIVIPSPLMTLQADIPIDEFVRNAQPTGVKVFGSIYGRGGYNWPFSARHDDHAYADEVTRDPDTAQILGAILNQRRLGADGVELFNFSFPSDPQPMLAAIREGLAQKPSRDRRYQITQAYFLDSENSYEYRKQVPAALQSGEPLTLRLLVGEDLSASTPKPEYVGLRIGLHGANQSDASLAMRIKLNDDELHSGDVAKRLIVTTGRRHGNGTHTAPTEAYIQIQISDLNLPRAGWNDVEVTLQSSSASKPLQVVELELGVTLSSSENAPK